MVNSSEEHDAIAAYALSEENLTTMHGFVGDQISEAWITRLLVHRGSRFTELLLFSPMVPEGEVDAGDVEHDVLTRTRFEITSSRGPTLLIDRALPGDFEDPHRWTEDALNSLFSDVGSGDSPLGRVLSDEQFWKLIGLLDGEVSEASVRRLSTGLRRLSPNSLELFRDTLAAKLFELDDPGNTVSYGEGDDAIVSADASLYYRCEIVAKGPRYFDLRLSYPLRGTEDDGATGELLLGVAEDAAEDALPPIPVDVETGANRARWEAARETSQAGGPALSPGSFSREVQLQRMRLRPYDWYSFEYFVAYAASSSGVRELIGCLMAKSVRQARIEVDTFLSELLRGGEQLVGPVIGRTGIDGVADGESVATLSRRSRLSLDEYVAAYRLR